MPGGGRRAERVARRAHARHALAAGRVGFDAGPGGRRRGGLVDDSGRSLGSRMNGSPTCPWRAEEGLAPLVARGT
jgi:hypothetical protein